jgi:hypothetical protein
MIKVRLVNNDFILTIATSGQTKQIEITNGKYNGKNYSDIIFSNDNIILEGDDDIVLQTSVAAAFITVKGIRNKIAEILGNEDVYLIGINAIPEGEEKKYWRSYYRKNHLARSG